MNNLRTQYTLKDYKVFKVFRIYISAIFGFNPIKIQLIRSQEVEVYF